MAKLHGSRLLREGLTDRSQRHECCDRMIFSMPVWRAEGGRPRNAGKVLALRSGACGNNLAV
jgi:hypothetical protein